MTIVRVPGLQMPQLLMAHPNLPASGASNLPTNILFFKLNLHACDDMILLIYKYISNHYLIVFVMKSSFSRREITVTFNRLKEYMNRNCLEVWGGGNDMVL